MFAELPSALRLAREKSGVSQEELARRSGLTAAMLSRYERGERSPRLESLDALLAALGLDLRDLAAALDEAQGRAQPLSPEIVAEVREAAGDPDLEVDLLRELAAQNARILARLERRRGGT